MKTGWWSSELPGYRPHARAFATYTLFSYKDLPPIPEKLDNDFEWLKSQAPQKHSLFENIFPDGSKPDLSKLASIVSESHISLPEAFATFMNSIELQKRVRSCTDCYLEVSDYAVKTKGSVEGHLLHFLSDSQWIVHWYIHVDPRGNHCVVTSLNPYGFNLEDNSTNREIDMQEEEIWHCAPSFTEFIYRFWLENEIWFALAEGERSLNQIEQSYVDKYVGKSK